jgi:hypothetical protein
MHIFLDETGSFGGVGQFPSPSLVGALVIPDQRLSSVEKAYAKLRKTFPVDDKGEVKGRLLNENQVSSVVPTLFQNSALFYAVAIDLGTHTENGLKDFQLHQAQNIIGNLGPEHNPSLVEQAHQYKQEYEAFKLPLMVQSAATFELLPEVIELSMMYYSTRRPEELSHFNWVIDGKGNLTTPNDWERWWSIIIMPFMQSRWLRYPFKQLPIGDYSHAAHLEVEADKFVKQHSNWKEGDPKPLSLQPIMRDSIRFTPENELGLELVDILTNATRRALVGNLQKKGWERIPELMIHQRRGNLKLIALQDIADYSYPYTKVINAYKRGGRIMLPASLANKKF